MAGCETINDGATRRLGSGRGHALKAMLPSMHWHFLRSTPGDGATNMAVDEALMRLARRNGHATLRVYAWSSPTLSLGRNQRARGCYDLAAASRAGVSFVRRPTGGRALLHHREATYSVTMPAEDAAAASRAYEFINDVLLTALDRLGVPARRASGTPSLPPGLRPCFDAPAERELVVDDRKLVGSAQWRHEGNLLQHGSILIQDDQPMIAGLLLDGALAGATRAATLQDVLGRSPALDEIAAALRDALARTTMTRVTELEPDAQFDTDVEALRATYADDAWTWRR